MRKAIIDYLLSDACPYTRDERLMLFVLGYAIKANRGDLSSQKLAKACAMHRATVYRILKSLKAQNAIALEGTPDAPVYVIKDEQLVRVKRGTLGGTIGGDIINNTQNNNNNTNIGARAREGEGVSDATPVANKTPQGVSDATPRPTVKEDIAKHNQLQQQSSATTVAPERVIVSTDGHGGRIYRDSESDERKFLDAYHKSPKNEANFSVLFRQALAEAGGDVGKLIAAADVYSKALKTNNFNVIYKKLPEAFLSCCMWKDYLPETEPDAAPGYTGDEQAFLDAYSKAPRDADRFRTMFARALEEAGSVQALIAAYQDYAEQLRRKDNSLVCLPRPENWLEDCGWRDYTRRYGGSFCGAAGGQIGPPAPKSSGFVFTDEEDDDAY